MKKRQILQTDDERLRFAIRLASTDPSTIDASALGKLWQELGAFLGHAEPRSDLGFKVVKVPAKGVRADNRLARAAWGALADPEEHMRATLVECQTAARDVLERYVSGESIETTVEGRITLTAQPGEPGVNFTTPGRANGVRVTLTYLLFDDAPERVRKCPECGRIFVRVRRQIYCEDACTDRATWRNYPEQKKRQARKKQYAANGWTLGARSKRRVSR